MNVALYRPNRWAMTERRAKTVSQNADTLQIGPSALHWDGKALIADIDEITAPVPRALQGRVMLIPSRIETPVYALDAKGRHRWRPIAPRARIQVRFAKPDLSWEGHAYFDSNAGDVPLGHDFRSWTWSRAHTDAATTVLYDVSRRDGTAHSLALNFDAGGAREFSPPPPVNLPMNLWRVKRRTRADRGFIPSILQEFEAAPFYSRSKITTQLHGERLIAIHESLDLDRFDAAWVRLLLPFRMPRTLF